MRQRAQACDLSSMHAPVVRACLNFLARVMITNFTPITLYIDAWAKGTGHVPQMSSVTTQSSYFVDRALGGGGGGGPKMASIVLFF